MILNIYKPRDSSSFSIVKVIKNITKEKKVGHGGTLDPFAEGVLIIGTGNDTKKLSEITNADKSYDASLFLGSKTNTLDPEGRIIQTKDIPKLERKIIKNVLNTFKGISEQIPPMFSAKKINGKRLYKLARKNIVIPRDPNKITIKSIKLISFNNKNIRFSVSCTKGTYIRVLGNDIAEKLGTVGYLDNLVRTSVGNFSINDSITVDKFQSTWK